jgi:hypothetical protein
MALDILVVSLLLSDRIFLMAGFLASHIEESAECWVGVSVRCAYRRNIVSRKEEVVIHLMQPYGAGLTDLQVECSFTIEPLDVCRQQAGTLSHLGRVS